MNDDFHMCRMYAFVRGRQLEGTFPGDPATGVWVLSGMRIQKGWGMPPEAAWPYDGDAANWPPEEPAGMDALAKRRRIFAYGRVRSLDDGRRLLAEGGPFVAAFEIDESWYGSVDGVIAEPDTAPANGSHTILIIGYDDRRGVLKFANSWGADWGDGGFGYLPYAYWGERLLEAWYQDLDRPAPRQPRSRTGVVVQGAGVHDRLDRTLHIVEIEDRDTDETIGWALTVQTPTSLELEDLFVRPQFRGTGYGRELAREVLGVADMVGLPLTAWIAHADWGGSPSPQQDRILAQLGLTSRDSNERWAAQLAAHDG